MGSCCTKNHNKGKTRFTLQQNGQLFTYKSLPKIPKSMQNRIDKNIWKEFLNLCRTSTQTQPECLSSLDWFGIYLERLAIISFFLDLAILWLTPVIIDCDSEKGKKICPTLNFIFILPIIVWPIAAIYHGFIGIKSHVKNTYDHGVYLTICGIISFFLPLILQESIDCNTKKMCHIPGLLLIFGFITFVIGSCIVVNGSSNQNKY
eukprot:24320_1